MAKGNERIKNNENSSYAWMKKHKKGILLLGALIVTIGVSYVLYKNRDSISNLLKSNKNNLLTTNNIQKIEDIVLDAPTEVKEIVKKRTINEDNPFSVSGHFRNLPKNRRASSQKAAQALALDIVLGENQTLVDSYFKNCAW